MSESQSDPNAPLDHKEIFEYYQNETEALGPDADKFKGDISADQHVTHDPHPPEQDE